MKTEEEIRKKRMKALFEEGRTLKQLEGDTIKLDKFEKLNKKLELCFAINDTTLSDDYEEWIEENINYLDLNNLTDLKGLFERSKKITVIRKLIYKLDSQFLMEHIEDYLCDNWCYDGYEHGYLEDKIGKNFFDGIVKKFNKHFHWYIGGHNVCFLDLSPQIKEHIKSYYLKDLTGDALKWVLED